jgi:hypothetical protein
VVGQKQDSRSFKFFKFAQIAQVAARKFTYGLPVGAGSCGWRWYRHALKRFDDSVERAVFVLVDEVGFHCVLHKHGECISQVC